MKKSKTLAAVICVATVFVACDPEEIVDSLIPSFDITEVFVLEAPIVFAASTNSGCLDYNESNTFDVRSNSEINENWSFVEDVQVNSISWEVTNYVGDGGVFINSGILKVGETSFEIGQVDLKASDLANSIFELTDAIKLSDISNEIKSSSSLTVIFEVVSGGNCESDHSYSLNFNVDVTVTVQPSLFD